MEKYDSYKGWMRPKKELNSLDEILKLLILKDKGIEINTSGIRYGLGNPHPNIDILKRYKENLD